MKRLFLIVCLAFCLIESKGQDFTLGTSYEKANAFISSHTDTLHNIGILIQGVGSKGNADKYYYTYDIAIANKYSDECERNISVSDSQGRDVGIKLSIGSGIQFFISNGLPITFYGLPNGCSGLPSNSLYKDSNNFLKVCP